MFRDYDTTFLARALHYSETYILDMKEGRRAVTLRFRKYAIAVLGKAEDELFSLATGTETDVDEVLAEPESEAGGLGIL